MRFYTKLIAIFLLATSVNAFGIVDSKLIGEYGSGKAWMARVSENGDQKICFMSSNPISTSPDNLNRGSAALMITNMPNEKVFNEPSVQAGFPFKLGSNATMIIGDSAHKLFTAGEGAWVEETKLEKKIIQQMRKGSRVKVKSISTRNTKITDTYSLIGFTKALEAINKACS
jgi:invasion protein IalB|tara:strand:+ start:957 stop:1472 length:516 start_codon:yes stop_codon:yes gene_type:complete